MAVGCGLGMDEVCLQMGNFVEEHPEKEVLGEVAADGDFVLWVAGVGRTVVAQFGASFACNAQVDTMQVEVDIHPFDRFLGEVAAEDGVVAVEGRVVHASSRSRCFACVCTSGGCCCTRRRPGTRPLGGGPGCGGGWCVRVSCGG